MGDEVFGLMEQSIFGLTSMAYTTATVTDSWELRVASAALAGIFSGIFGDILIMEIDDFADTIEIRRLSEPYLFFPILFTFSDSEWAGHPNAKPSNLVLESTLLEDVAPPEITFTDDTGASPYCIYLAYGA